ncbi:MAG: 2-hydroxyacid dehydrogenase [archaeon]|nr:2-hydroxyacid dehydrogenase [archaeon]
MPEVAILLPVFFPLDAVKMGVSSILPGTEVRHDRDFTGSDARVLVVTTFTKVGSDIVSKMPNLKFVQVASTGYDNVDISLLKSKGVKLSNIPIANKESVAEHVIMMTLALLRDLIPLDSKIKNKNWPSLTQGRELKGKVFAIIGMGAIGTRLAERLLPFEVSIVYCDIERKPEEIEQRLGVSFLPLDECLKTADIISLHLPLTDETKGIFSKREFDLLKNGAIFINTSRAEIVDENALIETIKTKGIRAGIDVFPQEPPNFDSELFQLNGVIFSPHSAGATAESQERFMIETVRNVAHYLQGVDPLYQVI